MACKGCGKRGRQINNEIPGASAKMRLSRLITSAVAILPGAKENKAMVPRLFSYLAQARGLATPGSELEKQLTHAISGVKEHKIPENQALTDILKLISSTPVPKQKECNVTDIEKHVGMAVAAFDLAENVLFNKARALGHLYMAKELAYDSKELHTLLELATSKFHDEAFIPNFVEVIAQIKKVKEHQ